MSQKLIHLTINSNQDSSELTTNNNTQQNEDGGEKQYKPN